MLTAIIPVIAALIGLVVYAISNNARVAEIGRILFFTGALVTLFVIGRGTVRLL